MKNSLSVAGILALTFATCANAQMPPPPAPITAAQIQSGTYASDPQHTEIVFSIDHQGFSAYYGQFVGVTGTLQFDAKAPAASKLDVTIPIASVLTSATVLNEILTREQWFDTGKFPTATFKSTSIVLTGADSGKITGDLTLHGVTKPVTLIAKFHGGGTGMVTKKFTIGFDATVTIKRSDFGVKAFLPLIGDDTTLMIAAAFEKQS